MRSVFAPSPAARSASRLASAARSASGFSSSSARGEPRGEVGELFGPVLGPVVGGHRVVVGLARFPDRRLGTGQVGGRVERYVQVRVGEQLGDGPGRGLVLADGLVGRCPPGSVPLGAAGRLQVGEAGLGRGLRGQVPGAPGVVPRAHGGVGRVGGGDERVGGLAGGAQRGVQVGLAAELGQQRLAVPSGAQVGLCGLAQAGFALFGQLGEVFPGVGDGLVESLERGLELAVPGRRGGQFRSLRPPLTGGRLEPGRVGLERDQVRGDGEPVALEPGGEVGDADVGGAQPRADRLGPLRGLGGLCVRVLLLLAGHPLAAQLAQLRVIEGAADRAGGAVDQGGGELGAHAVDARLA